MSGILSLALVLGTVSFAQDELPPVPSFTPQSNSPMDSTSTVSGLNNPSTPSLAPIQSSAPASSIASNVNAKVMANPDFQANFRKPFVGQTHGAWPPSFGVSRPASSQVAMADKTAPVSAPSVPDLPPLPSEPETASVNPPVAQVPVIGIPGPGQNAPRQSMNPYSPAPAPAAPSPYQQGSYQQAPQTPAVPSTPQIPQNQPYSSPTIAPSQPQVPAQPMNQPSAPVQAQSKEYMFKGGSICPLNIRPTQPGEHPMAALIPWANEGLQTFNAKIKDYSCVMIKRERINGQLQDSSTLYMKIREEPFSIYVKYLKPDKKAGVEALYRKGYHNDQLLGHDVGFRAMAGSLWLDPNGRLAMAGQKYPITDGGIPNLVKKMMETVRLDMKNDPQGKETFVKFVEDGGNIDGRPCIRVDVMHPVKRPCYRFHRAEILLDKEWGIPVRYAAWMWPTTQGGKPVLDEEFTYTKLQFNRGFTDWDFNEKNKEYRF